MRSEGGPKNRVAASLGPETTESCLAALRQWAPHVSMAEVRLDRMASFELDRLIAEAPCPLILTCRPPREGGAFAGSEAERLDILAEAAALGCAWVDVEWDALDAFSRYPRSGARVIASRHWLDRMPEDLGSMYEALRGRADAVKLVGAAEGLADVWKVLRLLRDASSPVIAIAMGEAGRITRLLAPCFDSCLVTYGAMSASDATAPGQLTLAEMIHGVSLHEVTPQTRVHVHLSATPVPTLPRPVAGELHVPLVLPEDSFEEASREIRSCLPGAILHGKGTLGGSSEEVG